MTAPRLPYPYRDEAVVVEAALAALHGLDWPAVVAMATPWVEGVRASPAPFWAMESLLREYPITSAEGLALMRLAEALLRVPDAQTAIALTADQLGRADFSDAPEGGPHRMLASLSSTAIALSKNFLPHEEAGGGLLSRLGSKTVVAATVRAIQLLGRQFVLGRHIGEAIGQAQAARRTQPTLRFSYDMLGEGARTERDAQRYLASYQNAIAAIAKGSRGDGPDARGRARAAGISIKLSALFSRYEDAQRERVFAELVPRVWTLIDAAARADMNLTVDAEESDRLELSLDVFEQLAARIAQRTSALARLRSGDPGVPDACARSRRLKSRASPMRTTCNSWCGWSRARTGTARSNARRSRAWPATRCSRTSSTPTSRTWPVRAR